MGDNQYTISIGTEADTSNVEDLAAKLQEVEDAANNAGNAIGGIDTGNLGAVDSEAKDAAGNLGNVDSNANNAGKSVEGIPSDTIKEVAKSSNDAKEGLSEGADAADLMSGALSAIVGLGIVNTMYDLADAAGSYEDSWDRVALLTTGSIGNMDAVKDRWNGAITSMQTTTGRGAGLIRGHIQSMSIAGVKDSKAIVDSFDAISGASFATGTDIGTMENAFQRTVQTGTLSTRTLMALGISNQDVYKATGMSVDDLKTKFKTMTADQRAAMLAQIVNTKYGQSANDAYKQSWDYVKDQAGLAGDYLKRVAGEVILPILIPAIETATIWLKQLGDWFNGLSGPEKTFLGTIIVVGGALGIVASALLTLMTIKKAFTAVTNLSKLAQISEAASTQANAAKSTSAFSNLGKTISDFGSTTKKSLSSAGSTVASFASNAGSKIKDVGTAFINSGKNALTAGANYVKSGALAVASAVKTGILTLATWAQTAAQAALNFVMSLNPITIIIIAIVALVAVLLYLWTTNEGFRNALIGAWTTIAGFFGNIGGVIWGYLTGLIAKFLAFRASVINSIISTFSNVVNTARSYVSQLPGIVWNEMINIGNKIAGAAGYIFQQVQNVFGNIVQWAMKALGIASPGYIARAIGGEMGYVVDNILNAQREANSAAAGLGNSILSGFGSPILPSISTSGYGSASLGYNATEINSTLSANANANQKPQIVQYINQEGIMSMEEAANFIIQSVKDQLWKENIISGKSDE